MTINMMWHCLVLAILSGTCYGKKTDYCSFTKDHALCKYSPKETGKACGDKKDIIEMGIKKDDQKEIVRIHNEYRNKVALGLEKEPKDTGGQPPASNMRETEWDKELEEMAQAWVNQCIFQHDCQDCRKSERFRVGQNLFMGASSKKYDDYIVWRRQWTPDFPDKWEEAIGAWYDEEIFVNPQMIEHYDSRKTSHVIGHYTAAVWADTYKVGCGYIEHKDEQGWYVHILGCNYAPAGNIISLPVYIIGKACSECPEGTKCDPKSKYPGLCSDSGAS